MNNRKRNIVVSLGAVLALAAFAQAPAQAQTSTNPGGTRQIPPIVQAWADAWNSGDAEGMAALFTDDGVYEDYAFQASWDGPEAVAQWVEITVTNIPDARAELLDAYMRDDRATLRWVFHGTPERMGPIGGTGKTFSVSAVSIFELESGKISRVSDFYNLANLFRQLELEDQVWTPPFGPDVLK
jgi:steroid delta-isomerase-like uncharacterized protein